MNADAGSESESLPEPSPDPDVDVVTDLFSDDPDVARRRTVAAMVALSEQELSEYDRRAIAAVLDGTFSDDDARRVATRVQLADGYLTDPQVTAETDQQMTLLLVEKALRLTGVTQWRVCRRGGDSADSEQERMIAERRVILSVYSHDDDSTSNDTSGDTSDSTSSCVAPFDPRAVSVTYLATTRCTSDVEADTADTRSTGTGSASRGGGVDDPAGASGERVILSPVPVPVPRRRPWWRRVFGSGTDAADPGRHRG